MSSDGLLPDPVARQATVNTFNYRHNLTAKKSFLQVFSDGTIRPLSMTDAYSIHKAGGTMLFRKFAALLSGRTAPAPKPAPELESIPAFRAHLLARGLSPQETSDVIVARTVIGAWYWHAKGYTEHQIFHEMPVSQRLAKPIGKADRALYAECARSRYIARQFGLHQFNAD
jgi:hypothetical protein